MHKKKDIGKMWRRRLYVVQSILEEIGYISSDASLLVKGVERELAFEGRNSKSIWNHLRCLHSYMKMERDEMWESQVQRNFRYIDRFFKAYGDLPLSDIRIVFQVHGYAQIPYVWEHLNLRIREGNRFESFDKKILPIPLGYYFHNTIEDNAQAISKQITQYLLYIYRRFGRRITKVSAIAHSKGGLVMTYYMKDRLFEKVPAPLRPLHVTHLVCLSSPHNGTYSAYLEDIFRAPFRLLGINLTGGSQLKPYSPFLKKAHDMDLPGINGDIRKTEYALVRSSIMDYMVFNRFTHPRSVGRIEDFLYNTKPFSLFLPARRGVNQSRIVNYSEEVAIPLVKRRSIDKFGHCVGLFSEIGYRYILENIGIQRRGAEPLSMEDFTEVETG